jgi:hypothetical protein
MLIGWSDDAQRPITRWKGLSIHTVGDQDRSVGEGRVELG